MRWDERCVRYHATRIGLVSRRHDIETISCSSRDEAEEARPHAQNWDGHWCVILWSILKSAIAANFLVDCLLAHPGSIGTRPLDNPGSHLPSLSEQMDSDLSHSD